LIVGSRHRATPARPKGRTIESLRFRKVAVIDRKADATVGVFCDEKAALKAERLAIRLNRSRNSD
jgi:hypothetical protein